MLKRFFGQHLYSKVDRLGTYAAALAYSVVLSLVPFLAVTFIIGNSHGFPHSLFDSGSTIASTIANEFAEATSDMHSAALIALGLVLFAMSFTVLSIARAFLYGSKV